MLWLGFYSRSLFLAFLIICSLEGYLLMFMIPILHFNWAWFTSCVCLFCVQVISDFSSIYSELVAVVTAALVTMAIYEFRFCLYFRCLMLFGNIVCPMTSRSLLFYKSQEPSISCEPSAECNAFWIRLHLKLFFAFGE